MQIGAPRLSLEFQHRGPLQLRAFGDAITRLDLRYHRLAKANGWNQDAELQITDIRQGSTIVEIATAAGTLHSALTAAGDLSTIAKYAKDLASMIGLFKKPNPPVDGLVVTDCDDVRAVIKPVITSDNGGLSISIAGDNNFVQPILLTLSGQQAREIDNRAALARDSLQAREERVFRNVLLTWFQVRDAPGAQEGKPTPDRGVITEIDGRALPIRFADPNAKEVMIGGQDNPFHCGFIVDVNVLVGQRGPVAYLVLRLIDVVPLDLAV